MPYRLAADTGGCAYAVVKDDGSGDVVGCHRDRASALRHLAALYANVPDAAAEKALKAPAEYDGAMVCLYLSEPDAAALAGLLPPGDQVTPTDEIHLTLVYIDEDTAVGGGVEQARAIASVLASTAGPLTLRVSGLARFSGKDTDPLVVLIDNDTAREWNAVLSDAGLNGSEFGYTPHITLAYLPDGDPTPTLDLPGAVTAVAVAVVRKGERSVYPLGVTKHYAGQHDQATHGDWAQDDAPAARPLTEVHEVVSLLASEEYVGWVTDLPEHDLTGVQNYTGDGFYHANKLLRHPDDVPPSVRRDYGEDTIARLDSAFASVPPLKQGIRVYRSGHHIKALPGDSVIDRGFVSTTISPDDVLTTGYVIDVPAGTKAIPVGLLLSARQTIPRLRSLDPLYWEAEVLLPRGSEYELVGFHDGRVHLRLKGQAAARKVAEKARREPVPLLIPKGAPTLGRSDESLWSGLLDAEEQAWRAGRGVITREAARAAVGVGTEFKHYPGGQDHNQEEHGNWSSGGSGGGDSERPGGIGPAREPVTARRRANTDTWLESIGTSREGLYRTARSAFDAANDDQRKRGMVWYEEAHDFSSDLAERYGVSVRQAAGVVAALSPRAQWDSNKEAADKVLSVATAKTFRLDPEDVEARYERAVAIAGEMLKKRPTFDHAGVVTRANATREAGLALSARGDIPTDSIDARILATFADTGKTTDNTQKAIEIIRGQPVDEVLSGAKVRSFYSNIISPDRTPEVTIDTHIMNALTGRLLPDSVTATVFRNDARYEAFAEAIERVAREEGIKGHQAQAIIWVRQVDTLGNKRRE